MPSSTLLTDDRLCESRLNVKAIESYFMKSKRLGFRLLNERRLHIHVSTPALGRYPGDPLFRRAFLRARNPSEIGL